MTLLRSLVFNLWFYGLTVLIVVLIVLPILLSGRLDAPAAMTIARRWAALMLFGLRHICGTTWQLTGRENLPAEGPALIASMHQSAFDTMVWLLLVPNACYVIKQELLDIPVFGHLCARARMIAVDRATGAQAIRSLLKGADRAVADRRHIIIFPEGTRVAPGQTVALQPGIAALASRTGLPVIPVATDSGTYWGRRAFRRRSGVIRIAIGQPIPAGIQRHELMTRLEAALVHGAENLSRK